MGFVVPQVITEDRASGAQIVDGSLKFDSAKSNYLTDTPGSVGNRKTWTWSGWFKRVKLATQYFFFAGTSSTEASYFGFASEKLIIGARVGGAFNTDVVPSMAFRDFSSWYHLVVTYDSTIASPSSDRVKVWVNGVRVTQFDTATYPNQNIETYINSTNIHYLGRHADGYYSDIYFSNINFIDGQALDQSYFGYTDALTNTWRPKKFKPQATPNNGTTWSSATVSGSGTINASYPVANAFNGSLTGNNMRSNEANTDITLTLPSSITFSSSIRVYHNQNGTVKINSETPVSTTGGGANWVTVYSGSGNFSSLTLTSSGGDTISLFAVEVDGVILIDGDTSNMGLNGFYLPLDGNTPIGQDQSGRGNNWTPVNFGGSNSLEKATGALPILNTDGGGKVARVGVRTDSNASSLVLALPLVGISSDFSNAINSGTSNKTITVSGAVADSTTSNFYGGSFDFDGTNDIISTPDSSDFDFSGGEDFTIELWYNPDVVSGSYEIMGQRGAGSPGAFSIWLSSSSLNLYVGSNGGSWGVVSGAVISSSPQVGKWQHIAIVRNGNNYLCFHDGILNSTTTSASSPQNSAQQLSIGANVNQNYYNGKLSDIRIYKGLAKYTQNFIPASTDPDILPDTPSGVSGSSKLTQITDGAVAFDSGDNTNLSIADSTDFDHASAFTWEGYFYLKSYDSSGSAIVRHENDGLDWYINTGGNILFNQNTSTNIVNTGNGVMTLNKWVHIAVSHTGSVCKMFVDGIEKASATTSTVPDNVSGILYIGETGDNNNYQWNGFISNLRFVNGTALYTSNFTPPSAPITSVANTKLLCCQSTTSATAYEVSPGSITANGNASATNFNPFNTDINTVRGQESGYATLNPLDKLSNVVLTNGNLTCTSGANVEGVRSTIPFPRTGMWYVEYHMDTVTTNGYPVTGIANASKSLSAYTGTGTASVRPVGSARNLGWVIDSTDTPSGYMWTGFALSAGGDTMQIVFNADKGAYYMGVNNSFWGLNSGTAIRVTPQDMLNGTYSAYDVSGDDYFAWAVPYEGKCTLNYGQKPFKFPPPEGFQPLNAANVRPSTVIARPDQYVGIVTYTGNGGNQTISGLKFSPDFVWVKSRSNTVEHAVADTVRGATNTLFPNNTNAEATSNAGDLQSFTSDGFTISSNARYNELNWTYAAWCWKAGGSGGGNSFWKDDVGYATASAAGLTAGTITPSGASVNTKSGFSIVTYTGNGTAGATISHGLGNTPKFLIIKRRNTTGNWLVYHGSLANPATKWLGLNLTNAEMNAVSPDNMWNSTAPTSSLVTLGTDGLCNSSGSTYVAYLWAEIPGFSKFGSYTGNGSADGPFVYTGFRPKWLMIKRATGDADDWQIRDTSRSPYNTMQQTLFANLSNAEVTLTDRNTDHLSNGFKLRGTDPENNASGATYIYAAFAEAPSFNLYGGQANAR